jgi:prepilin-type N-terminal cleavage/methylation domain-containing protein
VLLTKQKGFTIVELLIVIVVIAILAAITIVSYNGIQKSAIESSMKSDISNAAKILAMDNTNNGYFPESAAAANSGKGLPASNGSTLNYTPTGSPNATAFVLVITNSKSPNSYTITDSNFTPTPSQAPVGPVISNPASNVNRTHNPCELNNNLPLVSAGTGTPTPTVQWQRLSAKNTETGTWINIPGATTQSYTYNDTELDGNAVGEYRMFRVIYTSGSNSVTSPTIKMRLMYYC